MKNIKRSNNVFEITVNPEELDSKLSELEEPGLTKEYLEECKKIAKLYKKGGV